MKRIALIVMAGILFLSAPTAFANWQKSADNLGKKITVMKSFKGMIYAGVLDCTDPIYEKRTNSFEIPPPLYCCEIWRSCDGLFWQKIEDLCIDKDNKVAAMEVFKGNLYIALNSDNEKGYRLLKTANGITWTDLEPDFNRNLILCLKFFVYFR